MKWFFFLFWGAIQTFGVLAQGPNRSKAIIDVNAVMSWERLSDPPIISDDGNYVQYSAQFQYSYKKKLIFKATHSSWEKECLGADRCFFTNDSKVAVYKQSDTLVFLRLGTNEMDIISGVKDYKIIGNDTKCWLAYQPNTQPNDLILVDMASRMKRYYKDVISYIFSKNAEVLLLTICNRQDNATDKFSLKWINLFSDKTIDFWSSYDCFPSNLIFDSSSSQLVFMASKKNDKKVKKSIWYYNKSADYATLKVENNLNEIDSSLYVNNVNGFSLNGKWIFFTLIENIDTAKLTDFRDSIKVDIWRYNDMALQPYREWESKRTPISYMAVISTENSSRVIRLEHENEKLLTPWQESNNYSIVVDNASQNYRSSFRKSKSFYLISFKENSKRRIDISSMISSFNSFYFSPKEKYFLYFDWRKAAYISYNISTGKFTNITRLIPYSVNRDYLDRVDVGPVAPIAGWDKNDLWVLIYDNYDLWKVDPSGKMLPVNITNVYGRKHSIKLRLINNCFSGTLLFTGFNIKNKYNGFFSKCNLTAGNPKLLSIGPYTYYHVASQMPHGYAFDDGMKPIKSALANWWVVKRQSAIEAPNYYLTNDFQTFSPLTNYNPNKNYNWLKAELLTWKQTDGTITQGVLYKPENFDSTKKYPVIFNYYEALSQRLYEFPSPLLTDAEINIPWFVSRGYIVFTPDIYYKQGNVSGKPFGYWAYKSVTSAASLLSRYRFIDIKRMAIQGHSFGAAETNYILTHTKVFSAAAEMAGVTDPVSDYLSLFTLSGTIERYSSQVGYEMGHTLYGATPWERPELYRDQSAVLNADKVVTPLLIVHNKQDNQIPWRQAVEFYMALRRLGKQVWMLQYDEGTHIVYEKEALDYTNRLTQFFDYFLRNTKLPEWMNPRLNAK